MAMSEHKRWADMTPEERRRDQLRHFPTLLRRWRGGRAKLWLLTASHQSLTIRIERPGVRGNLHVTSGGLILIHSPGSWEDCCIDVELTEEGTYVVRDEKAGVEIRAKNVSLFENCKPIYTPA
jgi:hypothetical protein